VVTFTPTVAGSRGATLPTDDPEPFDRLSPQIRAFKIGRGKPRILEHRVHRGAE